MHFKKYILYHMVLISTFTFTFQCSENVLEQVQNFSPNTPPDVISFSSDSPGAGLVTPGQNINITFSASDLHNNTFTANITSTQGLFGTRSESWSGNVLSYSVPFTVNEPNINAPIIVTITLTDEKGATADYNYDLGTILPNVAPAIISATSTSPGGATLLPNQSYTITVEVSDLDPLTFTYSSLVGAFTGQQETTLANGNIQSTVTFVISSNVVPGFSADLDITITDARGGVTNYPLNIGTGKLGPTLTTAALPSAFMSTANFNTLAFSSDSPGFFQYTINNISGVNPVPSCSVNTSTTPFYFYTLNSQVSVDIVGSAYTGTGSGTPFFLSVPATDGVYQVCVGVLDTLFQPSFIGGINGVQLTQDSQPPVTSFTTLPASYTVATNVPVTCSDNVSGCDISAYTTSTSTTPTPPAAPALPVIDPVTHTVTAGTLYSTPLVLADATQTTISALSLDLAGNAGALQTATYIVDTTVPVVAINAASTSVISSIAGYDIATLTWSTNRVNLNYTIKSGTDCTTGTALAGLAGTTPPTANTNVTNLINAAQLAAGANTIWVCVDNLAAITGSSSHVITRDNTPPAISLTPLPGNFTSTTNLVMNCTDTGGSTCAVTGYTKTTSVTPALPAVPAAPALVAATKTVAAGTTQYTAPVALADATQTLFSYIAMDNVGNISTVTTTATPYIVETALPAVTISAVTVNGVASTFTGSVAPYDIATITWSTNRTNLNYTVKSGTCATGTPVANSTAMATPNLSGTTPATANTVVTTLINQADLANGANSLSICVTNLALNDGAANFTLNKDTSPPTVSISPAAGNFTSATNFLLACTENAGESGCAVTGYTTSTSTTPTLPAAPATPALVAATKTVAAGTTQYTAPVALADATQTLVSYIAMDNVGNTSTVTTTATPYIVETALPVVTVASVTVNGAASTNVGPAASYNIATITWSTNRTNLNYTVKTGTCATGTVVANSTAMATPNLSGVTPATANSPVVTLVNQTDLAAGPNTISICVTNLAGSDGFATTTINKDTTPPTISITPITGNYFVSSLPFTISCADNTGGSGCKDIDYYIGGTGPLANYTPGTITVAGTTANGTVTHANGCTQTTYVLNYAGRDNAMNLSSGSASYTLSDCVRVNLSMVAPATYTPNSLSVTLTNATTVTSSGAVSIAATGLNTVSGVTFAVGNTYNIAVSGQPANQICSFSENQFGTIAAAVGLTFNIKCVDGYMVGGRYQALPPAPLNYKIYQGKVTTKATSATGAIPNGIAFAGGDLFYVQRGTHQIFKCTAASGFATCTAFAGSDQSAATGGNAPGTVDGNGTTLVKFYSPRGMISDGTHLYVGQYGPSFVANDTNDAIRKIDMTGNVTTIIQGTTSTLWYAEGLALYNGNLYIVDRSNHQIKKLNLATGTISIFAGSTTGNVNGNVTDALGNATPANAKFNEPLGLAVLNGILYIGEFGNNQIRAINLTTHPNTVSTLNSASGGSGFKDGPVATAKFLGPTDVVTDGYDLYVSDYSNGRIRRIRFDRVTPTTALEVTTIAGQGPALYAAGTGINAKLSTIVYMASSGNAIYFTDETSPGHISKLSNNGLVGHWPLNGTGGNANDYNSDNPTAAPGNINNGTSTAWPTLTASSGRYGTDSTYIFNGTQFITATNTGLPTGNADFTVSAWVKTQISGTGQKDILGNRSTGGQYDYSLIFENNDANIPGQITFARFDGTNASVCRSGVRIDDTKFHHVLGSKKGGKINLYIDGKLICQTADTYVTPITGGNFVIGSRQTGAINYFNGSIADVLVYARALNEGEINELAQDAAPAQVGPSYNTGATGLLSHYGFDNNAGTPSLVDNGPLNKTMSQGGVNIAGAATGKDGEPTGAYLFSKANDDSLAITTGGDAGFPAGTAPRTICAWVNPKTLPDTVTNTNFAILDYGTKSGTGRFNFTLFNSAGTIQIGVGFFGASTMFAYTPPINSWSHLCTAYDGNAISIYANGRKLSPVFSGIDTGMNYSTLLGGKLYIGSDQDLRGFDGNIDDVRVYNNVLSADQIRQLAVQVPAGLVARYDFTGDANDVSGFGNNASTVTATATTDRFSQANTAYSFTSASSQSITVPHSLILNPQGTVSISAWIRPRSLPATSGSASFIINKDIWGASGYGLELYNNLGTQEIVWLSPGNTGPHYAQTLPLNQYSHLTITQTGTTATLYINGTAISGTGTPNAFSPTTLADMIIGGANYFDGDIDDVRVYNRVLTQPEIAAMQ